MNFQQLNAALKELGVTPEDVLRASIYLEYLTKAQTYFKTTLAGTDPPGLGGNYPFVKDAVQSSNLLQQLADVLDFFIAMPVNADLKRAFETHGDWTYRNYFDNVILNDNNDTYKQNVADFMIRYPIAKYALDHLFANFRDNITQACDRIIKDYDLLTKFYADLYQFHFTIRKLKKIKSTGSDFHKGGKQVLILTFEIVHTIVPPGTEETIASVEELKVVYKPSDLEIDCLVIGNSAAVNKVIDKFMTKSLVEIYNARLAEYKKTHPEFKGEELPTYRVLPRNYISKYTGDYPLPIRNAYGYIQYLDNDVSGLAKQIFGYYPYGQSDYLIFKSQNEKEISQKFYKQEGVLCALASTFSLSDLHIENVRVMKYEPYLIDLEICLTKSVKFVQGTNLISGTAINGGIDAFHLNSDPAKIKWVVEKRDEPGKAQIAEYYQDEYFQNRLWRLQSSTQRQLVPVAVNSLLKGFKDGMAILREEVKQDPSAFAAWFTRVNNVVVRYLPYSTTDFGNIRTSIFISVFRSPNKNSQYVTQRDFVMLEMMTSYYQQWVDEERVDLPNFIVLTSTEAGADYDNLDIPAYYTRVGSQNIVNSNGAIVDIPDEITIKKKNPPPPTEQVAIDLGRDTFFPNFPTTDIVNDGQVQILSGGGYSERVETLESSIRGGIGASEDPDPTAIVPAEH